MKVAGHHIGKAGVFSKSTSRFVEGNLWQFSLREIAQKVIAVLEMSGPVRSAWGEASEIIERLMMRHEIRAIAFSCVNDFALYLRAPAARR